MRFSTSVKTFLPFQEICCASTVELTSKFFFPVFFFFLLVESEYKPNGYVYIPGMNTYTHTNTVFISV